ncbi:unnamed protein product [Peniophora sp. CBMAI 1063]|nr:unnamed protein product [Peniophora sp. CBMAI 1063]
MGRGGKRGRGRGRGARSNGPSRPDDGQANRTDVLGAHEMHNKRFESYYTRQNLVSTPEEWSKLLEAARAPLPTTFRIAAGRETAQVLKDAIEKTYVPHLQGVVFEGEAVDPPTQLSWYPGGLGWQFNVAKKVLRRSPEFKRFHSFLVYETEVGNITRQEAVSMLPPLFLDVQPHHKVMDMCAAPGSKTSQLLEFLHASAEPGAQSIPPGLLVANDSDYKRAQLLIHQSARLPSPAFLVTNMDASNYPTLSLGTSAAASTSTATKKPKMKGLPANTTPLLFDRILCDVPCSGDGTLRKNVGIWKTWNPMDGNGLHGLQTRILTRAMRMLEQGGRVVYSTCSLNPVENEAVIAEALKTVKGFELLDVSSHLPTLHRASGLHTWVPATDKHLTFHETYASYIDSLPEDKRSTAKMMKSHWPPSSEEVESLHLERCMRVYPHLQDTGGFFVAVLERKARVRKEGAAKEGKRAAEDDGAGAEPAGKKPRLDADTTGADAPAATAAPAGEEAVAAEGVAVEEDVADDKEKEPTPPALDGSFKEMPYTYLAPDEPLVDAAITAAHLLPTFPRNNLLTRNPGGEPARSLYLTNDLVRRVVDNNDFARIRLMAAGTRIFTRQEGGFGAKGEKALAREAADGEKEKEALKKGERPSVWRLLSEGLPAVLPFADPAAIIKADADALRVLIAEYYPLLSSFAPEYKAVLESKALGSHVSRFHIPPSSTHDRELQLCLPIWRSANSASLMIDKKAKSALSLRVFGEDVSVAGREAAQKLKEAREKKEADSASAVASGAATPAVEGEAAEVGAVMSAVAEGAAVGQDVEMKE